MIHIVDEKGIQKLAALTNLQDLNLTNTKVGDAALKIIGESLLQLQKFYAANSQIKDDGLAHLAPLKNLQVLHLGGYRSNLSFSDSGIKNLLPLCENLTE
jgi:hypothetical protein